MKKVGILIVTYNRLNLLKEEIDSIRNQTYNDYDIIVVNNGSTDGTDDWLANQMDIIGINQTNTGGAGGFFSGMKYIAENDYEYCWLMDDDVECNSDALKILVQQAEKLEDFGFLCSRVYGTNSNLMNVPIVDTRTEDEGYATWMEKIDDNLIKVKTATFVSVLIPTNNIRKFGLPIKEYFIWGDDFEYTTRLSSFKKSYCAYDSVVIHKRQLQKKLNFLTETDRKRINNYFYMIRNSFINKKKYGIFKDKFLYSNYILYLFIRSLLRLDFMRLRVLIAAVVGIFCFKSKIIYPTKQ